MLLLSPLVFVAHFLEESPGFVPWFNSHVARGITAGLFWQVNLSALFITLIIVGLTRVSRSAFALTVAVVWLSFLMLANAILHIMGGLVDGRYVPGLLTAVLLYLPYYGWFLLRVIKSRQVKVVVLAVCVVGGALPMLIHGYLIIFRGSRLF